MSGKEKAEDWLCPLHGVAPSYSKRVFRTAVRQAYKAGGEDRVYSLPELAEHRFWCEACERKDAPASAVKDSPVMLAFGKGKSAKTKAEAERRWRSAVAKAYVRLFKKAVSNG